MTDLKYLEYKEQDKLFINLFVKQEKLKHMKSKLLLIFLASFFCSTTLLQSCNKDDDSNGVEVESPLLEFSPSPISLNGIDAKFSKDISYGPFVENTFDIFMPNFSQPTPLVIYIHGGGFLGGEKENPYSVMWSGSWDFPSEIRTLLTNNIAFVSINYRLLAFEGDKEGVLKSLSDSKRCLQYIRSISNRLNIDKNNQYQPTKIKINRFLFLNT